MAEKSEKEERKRNIYNSSKKKVCLLLFSCRVWGESGTWPFHHTVFACPLCNNARIIWFLQHFLLSVAQLDSIQLNSACCSSAVWLKRRSFLLWSTLANMNPLKSPLFYVINLFQLEHRDVRLNSRCLSNQSRTLAIRFSLTNAALDGSLDGHWPQESCSRCMAQSTVDVSRKHRACRRTCRRWSDMHEALSSLPVLPWLKKAARLKMLLVSKSHCSISPLALPAPTTSNLLHLGHGMRVRFSMRCCSEQPVQDHRIHLWFAVLARFNVLYLGGCIGAKQQAIM